jgi:NAD(P)-dependent dehydrogenase (short-subunit alcohol dehydrogenase family)
VRVAILGRKVDSAERKAAAIREAGGEAMALSADVTDESQVAAARDELVEAWGAPDILVNAAGGNVQRSRNDNRPSFDVPVDAFDEVVRLNLHGTVIPSLRFAA